MKDTNRKIKFRVWDSKDKKFTNYIKCESGVFFTKRIDTDFYFNGTPFGAFLEIQQFTGLKDENGIEIYEGDIIHHGQEETEGETNEVIFQNGMFGMRWQSQSLWHILHDSHFFKVIGNIYENSNEKE